MRTFNQMRIHAHTKKSLIAVLLAAMFVAAPMIALKAYAASDETPPPLQPPQYNITGVWNWNYYYGCVWSHTMIINSFNSSTGAFSGEGHYNADPSCTWTVEGIEYGTQVSFIITYTGPYNPGYYVDAIGDLSNSTYMSGTATAPDQIATWDATLAENIPPGDDITVNPDPNVSLTFDHVNTSGTATVEVSTSPPEGFPPLPNIIGPYYNIMVTATFDGNVLVAIKYDDTGLSACQENRLRLCISDGVYPIGDVNRDGIVNAKDILLIMLALGTKPGDRRWNPSCDLNGDNKVNLNDLCIAFKHLGESSWTDITLFVDVENNIIYGETSHFSIFGVH